MPCAVVQSIENVITDAQSALDLLMTANYKVGTKNIVIDKKLVAEDFFILSTGLAGEILQKLVNYGGRIAIYPHAFDKNKKAASQIIQSSLEIRMGNK